MVICLEHGANLHMAKLILLFSLTVSCFSRIQIDFTFLVNKVNYNIDCLFLMPAVICESNFAALFCYFIIVCKTEQFPPCTRSAIVG